jgi:hypothetical protein
MEPSTLTLQATASFLEAQDPGDPTRITPTVDIVANTGQVPMKMDGWRFPVVLDFSGLKITSQFRPLRMNHDKAQGVGHTTRIGLETGVLTAAGIISRETAAARDVVASAKNGFPWQASVGTSVDQLEFIKEGQTVTVNGSQFAGPLNVVRASTLGEISFVDLGADDQTSMRVHAMETMTELSLPVSAPDPVGVDAGAGDIIARAKQERVRRQRINALVEEASSFAGADLELIGKIGDKCEADGLTDQQAELLLLRATRPRPPAPRRDEALTAPVLEAALCLYGGVREDFLVKDRDYGPDIVDRAYALRSRGILGTIAAALESVGIRPPHSPRDLFERALDHRWVRAEGFSTINLPGLIGNVANKLLLQAFTQVNATYDRIADQADFSNFHVHTMYRLDHLGDFSLVPRDGEIKHGSLSQTSFTNKLDTYGQMLTLARPDIINDDLNAFRTLTAQLARKGRIAAEKALYGVIIEASDSFYTVAQGNRLVGALGITELGAAEAALVIMADAWGDPIFATPRFLLVPPALKYMADQIYTSSQVMDFTAGPNKARPTDNPFRGRFEVVSSPYLQLSTWPGNSPTTWYLLADPVMLGAFQIAYLDGRRAPTIESRDALFNTLGIQWRCYWDFGVAQMDARGAIKSTAT